MNPTYGIWNHDDDGGPSDGTYGGGGAPRDLRVSDHVKRPCQIMIGGYLIVGVIMPKKRSLDKIMSLAHDIVENEGIKASPFDYSIPKWFKKKEDFIPCFRYCLAKLLVR